MLHIIRGLPGSGKTTFAKSDKFGGMFHLRIEKDMYWVNRDGKYVFDKARYGECCDFVEHMVEEAMKAHVCTIVSSVFCTKAEVQKYIDLADKYNSDAMVWRMADNFGSIHNVPEENLKAMKESFEDFPGENFVSAVGYIVTHVTPTSEEIPNGNTSENSAPLQCRRNGVVSS